MASDYGLNFGFRRSDESMATREGRFKTPATGNQLRQGSAVELDPANPGYLTQCGANPGPVSGLRGLLVQEEDHTYCAFVRHTHDRYTVGLTKEDKLSVMWAGVGTKVWFKNTPGRTRFGRDNAAVNIVDTTGAAVGDSLAWDGSKWAKSAGA